MKKIFSTEDVRLEDRFRRWRELCEDRLVPMVQSCVGNEPFQAVIEGLSVGAFNITKFSLQNLRASTTPDTIRHQDNKTDSLFLSIVLSGSVSASQNDRVSIDRAGDFSIRDPNTPWEIEHKGQSEVLAIELPRHKIENIVGSSRHFAGLTVYGHLPVASITQSFMKNLSQIGGQLTPQAAERMNIIGIDLVAASIAERMAIETPDSLKASLILQQAMSYIENNISDTELNPLRISVAVGVSLRYLQILFRDDGHNIAAWMWQKRLERAARRLSDPISSHISLRDIAYGCGFADKAHFSRRFRNHFGVSPREYRRNASHIRCDH